MPAPIKLTCHCGLISESQSLLSSNNLPIECDICHCNICRHQTGALGASYLLLEGPPSEKSLGNATAYKTSEKYTRYFCERCGCNVFAKSHRDGRWLACSGIVECEDGKDADRDRKTKNIAKVMFHEYVGDAKDGGITPFLTKLGERSVPCYATEPDLDPAPMKESELQDLRTTSLNQPSSSSSTQ